MKTKHTLFLFIILVTVSTIGSAQDRKVEKIEFNTLTRGYMENVMITADSVIFTKGGNSKEKQKKNGRLTTKKEWKCLLKKIQSIDLSNISELESPTMKRAFDGAKHSKIVIYNNGKSYQHLFDDENPHQILSGLMICIVDIKDRE